MSHLLQVEATLHSKAATCKDRDLQAVPPNSMGNKHFLVSVKQILPNFCEFTWFWTKKKTKDCHKSKERKLSTFLQNGIFPAN